jgi:hypothetical protein
MPAPAPPAQLQPAAEPPAEPPAGPDPDSRPVPPLDPLPFPRPPTEHGGGDAAEPRLSKRVPQAHLAAGLRRDRDEVAEAPSAVRDPLSARDALSRFQASQRAAREQVEWGDAASTGLPERSAAAERVTGRPEQSPEGPGRPAAEPERRTAR